MTLQGKRIARGWSQPELAKKSGVSVKVIRSLECGYRDVNKSQLVTLVNICQALECPISDILTDVELKEKMKKCERF